jgi:glucose/arabinose dehydrogenase
LHVNPREHRSFYSIAVLSLLAAGAYQVEAATLLTTTRVASGLTRPVYVASPPGDDRLFILEQRGTDARGRIKILADGVVLPTPFLTTDVLSTGSEQGLLGLAFPPDYATSGRFYVYYTDSGGTSRLARGTVSANPDVANPALTVIYSATQPFTNHNGGWLDFGPDGYLWLGLGDGGSGGDPGDRAENINVPLGKLLRFDVSGGGNAVAAPDNPFYGPTGGLDEVWCYGLRNPWRCSFDRQTGDLTIGDVGQNAWEEIDFAPADSLRGRGWNWGWKCYEGNHAYGSSTTIPCGSCAAAGCAFRFPAYEYDHTLSRCSVTGGYVYRGCAIPDLQGTYFFADYCGNQIYSGRFAGGVLTGVTNRAAELDPPGTIGIASISSFGEDAQGELYICDLSGGEVFKIVPLDGVGEADMPQLQVPTAAGDTLGATGAGNALAPGVTPFVHPGSRIRGVGYLADAAIRSCPAVGGNCLTTRMRLGVWDYDMTACVDPDSATLTRTFVFTNTAATDQPLAFVDVVAPLLGGDADLGRAYDAPTATETALLAVYETASPVLYVTQRGSATGAAFAMDVDSVGAVEARVAADQLLGNHPVAGPAALAMALSFDFGMLAASKAETLVVVTKLQPEAPTAVEPVAEFGAAPSLRALGPMPFRGELRLAFGLPQTGRVRLDVFDVRGRRLRRLVDGERAAGTHRAIWDGRDEHGRHLGAGLYFVRMHTPAGERSLRVVQVQ